MFFANKLKLLMDWVIRLNESMDAAGKDTKALANDANVCYSAASHWTKGKRTPDIYTFDRIAKSLKVEPAWLVYGVGREEGLSPNALDVAKRYESLKSEAIKSYVLLIIEICEEYENIRKTRFLKIPEREDIIAFAEELMTARPNTQNFSSLNNKTEEAKRRQFNQKGIK